MMTDLLLPFGLKKTASKKNSFKKIALKKSVEKTS
jgi:hypothetical protein